MTVAPGVLKWLGTPEAQKMAGDQTESPTTQAIIDRFPEFATMLKIPEVAALLVKASEEAWTPAYFQEQLWNTKWWKSTPESRRLWQTRKLVDPATAGSQSRTMSSNVIATANSLGVHLTPGEVAWYTEFASSEGWDATALTRAIVDTHAAKRFQAGTVNSTQDSLHATAANYGVNISKKNAFHWASQIATGRQTQDGFEDWARRQAKATFPTLAKEIDAGLTVRQIADPYLQIAADRLGLNPETMLITDPKWQRALQGRDAKGEATGPMTTLDWSRHIMSDPAYGYGKSVHAKQAALQLRDELGRTFGVST